MSENNKNLADIKDLSVSFMTDAGSIKAVEDVNFTIPRKTVVEPSLNTVWTTSS